MNRKERLESEIAEYKACNNEHSRGDLSGYANIAGMYATSAGAGVGAMGLSYALLGDSPLALVANVIAGVAATALTANHFRDEVQEEYGEILHSKDSIAMHNSQIESRKTDLNLIGQEDLLEQLARE